MPSSYTPPTSVNGVPINPSSIGPDTGLITATKLAIGSSSIDGPSTFYSNSGTHQIRIGTPDFNWDISRENSVTGDFQILSQGTNERFRINSAGIIIRNGVTGQSIVITRTYTDADNYAQGAVVATGSTIDFLTQAAGTGVGTLSGWTFDKPVRLKGYTVATLPSGVTGDTAYVTDALLPAFLAIVSGGGAIVTKVFYNGSNWVSQ